MLHLITPTQASEQNSPFLLESSLTQWMQDVNNIWKHLPNIFHITVNRINNIGLINVSPSFLPERVDVDGGDGEKTK